MAIEVNGLTVKRERTEIMNELTASAERKNVLGIFLDGQDEMITTAVTQISPTEDNDVSVTLEKTDLHGYPLEENPVLISKIKSVIRFKTLFNDPVYLRIRQRKSIDNLAA
jgi:hypothetical protein